MHLYQLWACCLKLLSKRRQSPYHNWKQNSGETDLFKDPEGCKTGQLNYGKKVDSPKWHSSQVRHVRLVLGWHEKQLYSVKELQPIERCNPHVQEYSKEHRHGNQDEHWGHENGESNKEEDRDMGDSLFTEKSRKKMSIVKYFMCTLS